MSVIATPESTKSEACPACLSDNLGWLLKQAYYALARELAAALEPLEITPRGHAVLAAAMTGALTQKELGELVGLDKTTMVVTLDELEAAGLARRASSPQDRRARVVEVTEAGTRKVEEANRVAKRVQTDVLSSLGSEGRAALLDGLCELVSNRLAQPAACKSVRRRDPRP